MDINEKKSRNEIFEYLGDHFGFFFTKEDMENKSYILLKRLKAGNFSSFQSYCRFLKVGNSNAVKELQTLINSIVNNNTSFFRYKPSFELFENKVLPELFSSKFAIANDQITIWSAGCSSGEEAYSIAISCLEAMSDSNPVRIKIIATDISSKSLNHASKGYYSKSKLSKLSEFLVRKYFNAHLGEDGLLTYAVTSSLRNIITFEYLNLFDENTDFPQNLDVIFCRNVFPYLNRSCIFNILKRFHQSLSIGGYLFTSATDLNIVDDDMFKLVTYGDSTCFQKIDSKSPEVTDITVQVQKDNNNYSTINKKKNNRKEYKLARIKNFIARLNSVHEQNVVINNNTKVTAGVPCFGFKIDNVYFCIRVDDIKEIIHAGELTQVPSSPSFVKGLMNYRGDVLTLVDISEFLGLNEISLLNHDHIHIIVLNEPDCLLGILISSFFITFEYPEKELLTLNKTEFNYSKSVFDVEGTPYYLLNLEDLISSEILDMNYT